MEATTTRIPMDRLTTTPGVGIPSTPLPAAMSASRPSDQIWKVETRVFGRAYMNRWVRMHRLINKFGCYAHECH